MNKIMQRFATWDSFLALMALAVLAYAVLAVPNFATAFNLSQAAAGISEKALIVFPMVLLIIAREIDLSVASILALCSVILGVLLQAGAPMPLAIVAVLACGGFAGAVNGVLVANVGLPSLVVTLGTMAMFRGIGYIILGTGSVNQFPESFTDFGIDVVPGTPIPWTFVPFLVLAPVFGVLLQCTAIGRRIYAIGGNPDTALYSGIKTKRMLFRLFVLSGVICALAAIIFTARLSNARANNALGFELDVITATFLGGVSAFGGSGKITGVLWALVLLAVLRNVLGLSQIGGDAQGTVVGCLLILSLLLSNAAEQVFRSAKMRRFLRQTGE
jgi:rhamnose transport system permease protein